MQKILNTCLILLLALLLSSCLPKKRSEKFTRNVVRAFAGHLYIHYHRYSKRPRRDNVGKFKDRRQDGQGTFTWSNGRKYVGEFKDGKYHGQGTESYKDGSKYVGKFKDGKRNGLGDFKFSSGQRYVGEFLKGIMHGSGKYYFSNGRTGEGEFKDGEPWNVSEYDKNGYYKGKFVNGKRIK